MPIGRTCREPNQTSIAMEDVVENAPPIPLNVVEYLERIFPDRAAGKNKSRDDERFEAGCVYAVRHLRAVFEYQTKNFGKRMRENY